MRKGCKYTVMGERGPVRQFASPSAAKAHAKKQVGTATVYKVCTSKSGRTIARAYDCASGRCRRSAKHRTKHPVAPPYAKKWSR